MITIHTLASGSEGNAALVCAGDVHILVDAGISARRIAGALGELGLSPQDLSAICITHSHSDHVSGLATIVKRWDVPILATAPCGRQLSYRIAGLEGNAEYMSLLREDAQLQIREDSIVNAVERMRRQLREDPGKRSPSPPSPPPTTRRAPAASALTPWAS